MGSRARNSNEKSKFRIDTAAKCNTLTLYIYQLLAHTGELQRSGTVFCLYLNHQLKAVAVVGLEVRSSNSKTNATFEILDLAQECAQWHYS